MFRKRIRPAQEEMRGTAFTIIFVLVWYAGLMRGIAGGGFQSAYLLFLVAGLLPVFTAVQGVRRALFYRRQGREIREFGNAARGRIVNVIMKSAPYEDSHHRTRYRRYYVLEAEVPDPVTGVVNRIESPAYSRPIHRYLAYTRTEPAGSTIWMISSGRRERAILGFSRKTGCLTSMAGELCSARLLSS